METLRRRLHRWTWIALVAVLGIALAPAVSHALAAAASDHPWTELCSSTPGQLPAAAGSAAGHGHADHCALCVQLGAAPLPSVAPAHVATDCERLGTPESSSAFARLPWHAAQPRGPPASA